MPSIVTDGFLEVLPREVRDHLRLTAGSEVTFEIEPAGGVVLRRVGPTDEWPVDHREPDGSLAALFAAAATLEPEELPPADTPTIGDSGFIQISVADDIEGLELIREPDETDAQFELRKEIFDELLELDRT